MKLRTINNFGDLCVGLYDIVNVFDERLTGIFETHQTKGKANKINILFESIFHADYLELKLSGKLLNLSQVSGIKSRQLYTFTYFKPKIKHFSFKMYLLINNYSL